jgi:RNA-directed DNA polymerase
MLQTHSINTNSISYTYFCYVVASVISPLLANIMLDPLDKELEKRGHKFARYADDFTILVNSPRAGKRVLDSISRYLSHRLKLVVNTTKSHVVKTSESKFLGFTFKRGSIQWHPKTLLKFKQQVRRLTNSTWGVSMHYQLFKTSQYLRGWINLTTLELPTAINNAWI